jgi:CIC family chloride channel protein
LSAANVAQLSVARPAAVPTPERPGIGEVHAVEPGLRARDVMRSPTALAPDTPIAAAATMLAAGGWPGAPVVADGRVVGVVTETDLVAHQLRGPVAADATVAAVMTREPLLAPSRYNLGRLVGLMLAADVAVVPIVDGDRLVGTVDMRDLLRLVGGRREEASRTRHASG